MKIPHLRKQEPTEIEKKILRKEKEPKWCPLMSRQCIPSCAWWNEWYEECAILIISTEKAED